MNLQKIYTSLLTADLAAAEDWYTKLLGRRPDHRPMDTLVQWELFEHAGLMLSSSDEIAARVCSFFTSTTLQPNANDCRALESSSGTTSRATTRHWRRCVILTTT